MSRGSTWLPRAKVVELHGPVLSFQDPQQCSAVDFSRNPTAGNLHLQITAPVYICNGQCLRILLDARFCKLRAY